MRAAQMNAGLDTVRGHSKSGPNSRQSHRIQNSRGRERAQARSSQAAQLHGLRWVPVPLALLAAAIGWLVFGTVLGQAAATDRANGLQAGGLGLTVNQMVWMADAMSGPAQSKTNGFAMPSSMMPGMQTPGVRRLRIEVYITNVSTQPQRYALGDFRVVGPGGKVWNGVANASTRGSVQAATLEPRFQVTVELYFDIPARQARHLSVQWSHGGTTLTFPVRTAGTDSTSVMVGG